MNCVIRFRNLYDLHAVITIIVAITFPQKPKPWVVAKPIGADKKRRSATPNQIFGRAVTEKRIAHNLSQASLAASLGYSNYYLGRIERGRANITCDVMSAISSYFEMSIGQFWTWAEELAKTAGSKKMNRSIED